MQQNILRIRKEEKVQINKDDWVYISRKSTQTCKKCFIHGKVIRHNWNIEITHCFMVISTTLFHTNLVRLSKLYMISVWGTQETHKDGLPTNIYWCRFFFEVKPPHIYFYKTYWRDTREKKKIAPWLEYTQQKAFKNLSKKCRKNYWRLSCNSLFTERMCSSIRQDADFSQYSVG